MGTAQVGKSGEAQKNTLGPAKSQLADLHPEKWQALPSHGASPALAQAILSDPQLGMENDDKATPASAVEVPEI